MQGHATANQLAFGIVSTKDFVVNCYAGTFAANGAVLHQHPILTNPVSIFALAE